MSHGIRFVLPVQWSTLWHLVSFHCYYLVVAIVVLISTVFFFFQALRANDGTAIYNVDVVSNQGRRNANVNFNEGDLAVTITYTITADALLEDIESFTLTLSLRGATATGSTAGVYAGISLPSTATVFIIDCSCKYNNI